MLKELKISDEIMDIFQELWIYVGTDIIWKPQIEKRIQFNFWPTF